VDARIDLHAHTTVSDGTLSPTQLVELAAREGLKALALTDHDHVGGLAEARIAGKRLGVEVVTGIELSVTHPSGEFHLLGYLFDEQDPALLRELEALRNHRAGRAAHIVQRLQAQGVPITLEDVAREASAQAGGSVGRPHVARALLRKGLVSSVNEAFDRWLADGKPAAVPKRKMEARDALALLHGAGGIAVLAHPVTLSAEARDRVVRDLAALGLDGIEVVHSRHAPEDAQRFRDLARELGLLATGGSDFHGENKPDVRLGSGRDGNVSVDLPVLDALRRRAAARRRPGAG
jgi:predicted metal-dependent phosphoesterase TrpH